mmetsp:Transcript_112646/g.325481  ORF Transcript_112646/g.325481 Transcript_112646/m.325481 type:complete len:617 (+) Transcript_112646:21-1871(+)
MWGASQQHATWGAAAGNEAQQGFGQDRFIRRDADGFDQFTGRIIVVDLSRDVDRDTEYFEGRDWLEDRVERKLPLGWDLEWQPDFNKEFANPIALMQFADDSTALLLRTHRSRHWLPASVLRALRSEGCKKVGVGWDGADKAKMQLTFNFEPTGIEDIAEISRQKGLSETGLKALTMRFGWNMRKDHRVVRSNWAQWHPLAEDQVRYAAEDAYFTFLLYDKLRALPDRAPALSSGPSVSVAASGGDVMELEPGWEEEGIALKVDGFWCTLCNKGPMTSAIVVTRHRESKTHKRKFEQHGGSPGSPPLIPPELEDEGIVVADTSDESSIWQFRCVRCDAGPFTSLLTATAHVGSKKHAKKGLAQVEAKKEPVDPIAEGMWNLPDYVTVDDGTITCTLCNAKGSGMSQIYMHLAGQNHTKKCRAQGLPELIFVKERNRIELLISGKPIVRRGFTPPPRRLPDGWQTAVDSATGDTFYYNTELGQSQWERPGVSCSPSPPMTPRAEPTPESLGHTSARDASADGRLLPPGWQLIEASGERYYADLETRVSQWSPPEPYKQDDWSWNVDVENNAAYWARTHPTQISFYECDSDWERLEDADGKAYWSCPSKGIRFFELPP